MMEGGGGADDDCCPHYTASPSLKGAPAVRGRPRSQRGQVTTSAHILTHLASRVRRHHEGDVLGAQAVQLAASIWPGRLTQWIPEKIREDP